MTEGFPATSRRKCLIYRNTKLEMRYRKKKFETFTKKELADCYKQLVEKLRAKNDYSDCFSKVNDNPNDEDFVPATPVTQKSMKRKVFSPKKKENEKRPKKD